MASMLLDEMRKTMRRRHYSIRTERSYCGWVKRYVLFHKMRSRADLRDGEKKIEAFLNHLAIDLHVAPSARVKSSVDLSVQTRKVKRRFDPLSPVKLTF